MANFVCKSRFSPPTSFNSRWPIRRPTTKPSLISRRKTGARLQLKYNLPDFLKDTPESVYLRWLNRKAQSLVRRDRRRWKQDISMSDYKQAIHNAVLCSEGQDSYTGEPLDWSLLSRYDNRESQRLGGQYKRQFALLPTVDHADPESKQTDFRICGWRTNACKNDLTLEELKELAADARKFCGTAGKEPPPALHDRLDAPCGPAGRPDVGPPVLGRHKSLVTMRAPAAFGGLCRSDLKAPSGGLADAPERDRGCIRPDVWRICLVAGIGRELGEARLGN